MRYRVFSLIVILICVSTAVFAQQDNEPLRNHVILAFDESGCEWRKTDLQVMDNVREYLFDNSLLGENDYFSVVGVKADCSATFWKDFIYIKKNPESGKKLAFSDNLDYAKKVTSNQELWYQLADYQGGITDDSYSLLSISNPYILSSFNNIENKPLVNKTFILIVTDDRYNGNDFFRELQYFLSRPGYKEKGIKFHDVLKRCYQVAEEYSINYNGAKERFVGNIYHNVELFEVKPNQDFLTLPAVVSYSPSVVAVRERGGKYRIDLSFKRSNEHFDVVDMMVSLRSGQDSTGVLVDTITDLSDYQRTVTFSNSNKYSSVNLQADLRINDGFYDVTLLTPSMIEGLNQNIEIRYEEDAKFLFGLVRLPDFLWIPGIQSQQTAAIVLDFIILALVIAALAIYIKTTNTFVPDIKDVKIKNY